MTEPTTRPDRIDRQLLHRHHRLRDDKAHTELVRRHTPMVRSLARHHGHTGSRLELAVRAGIAALSEAIEAYDPSRGEPFGAYAQALALSRMAQSAASGAPSPWRRASVAATELRAMPGRGRDRDPRYEVALRG